VYRIKVEVDNSHHELKNNTNGVKHYIKSGRSNLMVYWSDMSWSEKVAEEAKSFALKMGGIATNPIDGTPYITPKNIEDWQPNDSREIRPGEHITLGKAKKHPK